MIEIDITANDLVLAILALDSQSPLALLDSCGRTLGASRFLIAGFEPTESFEFYCQSKLEALEILSFLDEKQNYYQTRIENSTLSGACIATFSYELGMLLENLPPRPKEFCVFKEPSATFNFYETLVIHDYKTGKTFASGKREKEFGELLKSQNPAFRTKDFVDVRVKTNFNRAEYLNAVERIRNHIIAGDIYQANLTQQILLESLNNFSPETVFLNLRKFHPAPFAAFIRRKNDALVSASPERFFQVQNLKSNNQRQRIITAAPIKGTRPRGKTIEEDLKLRRELETSAKDRAENVMIVDLLRNDIGRVCEFGSIEVKKLCEIEEHATLFHLVSTICGILKSNIKTSDLIKAAFPCGSITGAPKVRAMQILDEIETAPRNLSMGAIGYFGFDGAMDLNVAIRTAVIRQNQAVFNVGGGIVFDSNAESEYEESLIKARALLNSFGVNQII